LHKDDNILIDEIRSGSHVAFDMLMQRYQSSVYQVAYGFTKDMENALDITQNVFLKVFENISKFRSQSRFKTWLMRIAFNESHNWWKKNKRYQRHQDSDFETQGQHNSISQEEEYLAQENRALLLKSLYELNTKYRLAVVLRYFENYSVKDISQVLKCSEGVVKSILFRSIQKLKNNIKVIGTGASQ
jgi:RNA polymerase sigma-70 factor (ECF subfamily)